MAIDEKFVGKLFYDVPPYNDENTYLGFKNGDPELVLKTANFEYIQPFAHNDTLFQWRETEKSLIMGVACKIQLFYDKGITIRYEDNNGGDIASGMITHRATFVQTMTQLSQILRDGSEKEFANEVTLIQLALADRIWEYKTIECSFVTDESPESPEKDFEIGDFVVFIKDTSEVLKIVNWGDSKGVVKVIDGDGYNDTEKPHLVTSLRLFNKQPKFKVGDRILYPTKQNGVALGGSAKTLIEKAKNEKLGYLVVTDVTYNRYGDEVFNYWLGFQDLPNASVSFLEEECKPYEPKPDPKFKKGDQVKYDKMPFATFTVDNVTGFNWKRQTWVYKLNNNDKKSSYSAGYEPELKLIIAVETPKDCEADASKIISGQVKRFYDFNKSRIDKLDSKISCKIIQALVGLSEYESCGSPSSSTLAKTSTKDLLSRISNLKI
jgi:hypothetical protein